MIQIGVCRKLPAGLCSAGPSGKGRRCPYAGTGGSPFLCGYAGPYLAGDRGEGGGNTLRIGQRGRSGRMPGKKRPPLYPILGKGVRPPCPALPGGNTATMPCSSGREHAPLSDLLELSGQRGDCIFSIPETCNRKFFPIFAGRKPHPAGSFPLPVCLVSAG